MHRRLYIVDLGGRREELEDFAEYDPSEAIARELERERLAAEAAELKASLDAAYRESVEKARAGPPPAVVRSYQRIYGRLPAGWPPV